MSSDNSQGIPEISDDEFMDNDLQQIYVKEVNEGFFPSCHSGQPKSKACPSDREDITEKTMPYNSWRNSNRELLDSVPLSNSPKEQSMRSQLGKSLASSHQQIIDSTLTPQKSTPLTRRVMKGGPEPSSQNMSGERNKTIYPYFNSSPGMPSDSGPDPHSGNVPFHQYFLPIPFQGKLFEQSMNAFYHPNASQDMFMNSPLRAYSNFNPEQDRGHVEAQRNPYFSPYFKPQINSTFPDHTKPIPQTEVITPNSKKDCHCQPNISESPLFKKLNKQIQAKNKKIAELFRIAWLQNQQLGLLQKQVQLLIESNAQNEKDIKNLGKLSLPDSPKQKTKIRKNNKSPNLPVIEENTAAKEKVSVGIMTSFIETEFKRALPSPKCNCAYKTNNEQKNNFERASESSDESSSADPKVGVKTKKSDKRSHTKASKDESFTLNGIQIPTVVEQGISPESSMNLDLQDYKTSTSDSSDSESSSESSEEEGILPKDKWELDVLAGPSQHEIVLAAQKQAKKIGLPAKEIEGATSKRVTFSNISAFPANSNQRQLHADSDTSIRMNRLAQKYLKGELAQGLTDKMQDLAICNVVNGGTNLSFASMRYLERYHLVPSANGLGPQGVASKPHRKLKKKSSSPKENRSSKKGKSPKHLSEMNNILDVTAIRQQSKLLPK